MSHKGLKPKTEGTEPNSLCICGSGRKYKRCCGNFNKVTGNHPRDNANNKPKLDREEVIGKTAQQIKFEVMRHMLSGLRR